jgi:hypothetical protein
MPTFGLNWPRRLNAISYQNLVINEHKKGRRFPPLVSSHLVRPQPVANRNRFENYRGPTTLGGMPMNSSLASADFSKGRPAAERSNKLRIPATIRNLITRIRLWLGKLFSLAFARVLTIFLLGFAASIAWQSYGGGVRKAIAGWSPGLAWLAPAPVSSGGSTERLKAVSLALASARQSLDKLSTEINRLEVQGGEAPRRRATR